MPQLRPFRALRFDSSRAPDVERLICPPYDVVSPDLARALAARDAHNAIRVELPLEEPGDEADARYRRAARELVAWRTARVLRKDPEPSIYVYEQTYRAPADGRERTQRGFFARLKLEPFGPGGGVKPHERTLSGPKEDRLRLLRATGTNTSAVMALYRSPAADTRSLLDSLTQDPANTDVCDDDGVRHRLWVVPATDGGRPAVAELLAVAGARPVTIADGHHRYETAVRYSQERARACESDPPFDYVLCALYDLETEPMTILPTHRLVSGGPSGAELLDAARQLFEVEPVESPEELAAVMSAPAPTGGRFGLWTAGRGGLLRPRRDAFEPLVDERASETLRWLDVSVLAIALERLLGIDRSVATAGERLGYTKDAREALESVDRGAYDSAFLLDPTPPSAVAAVAEADEVMPEKSTYFYPKIVTGLLFNPLES